MTACKYKRVVFFEGDIETTAYFSRQMEKTFKENGFQTFFVNYENIGGSSSELLRFLKKGGTLVISFNFHGFCGTDEVFYDKERECFIWDDFEVPCINIVVDHPYYYHRFFPYLPKHYYHVSIDKNHEDYMKEYFPEIKRLGFLPLAGTDIHEDGGYKTIKERSMDVVFTGNYMVPSDFNVYIERLGDEYTAFYMGILEDLKKHPERTLEDVAKEHILQEIPEATHEELKTTMANLLFLDMYIRFYFRGEAIRLLAEAGIKVHVFGDGYENLECKKKENVIMGGPINSLQCLEKISDAKISLNVMPWFKRGAHDRIFNSMLNHAVCLTDSSEYLDTILVDGENAAVFDLAHMEQLPEIVKALLADEEKMEKIARAGYEMAKADHTWKQRAKWLIGQMQSL